MMVQEQIVNAAREGARLAALGGSTMGSSSSTGANEVNYRVRQYLTAAQITSGVTITISDSKLRAIDGGSTKYVANTSLGGINVRTYFARPDAGQKSQNNASDITGNGTYTLVGNASCRPNAAPTAVLQRSPADGCVPLTVAFDASSSTDPDAGDTIGTYQFDFGDGTPAVVQSAPTISHTYLTAGDYGARLHVTDSRRGRVSVEAAGAGSARGRRTAGRSRATAATPPAGAAAPSWRSRRRGQLRSGSAS